MSFYLCTHTYVSLILILATFLNFSVLNMIDLKESTIYKHSLARILVLLQDMILLLNFCVMDVKITLVWGFGLERSK